MACQYNPNQESAVTTSGGGGGFNLPLPNYIKQKNSEIAEFAMQGAMDSLKRLNIGDMMKVGGDLLKKDTQFLEYKLCPSTTETINFAVKKYMPEILVGTAGMFILGAILGKNFDKIKKAVT